MKKILFLVLAVMVMAPAASLFADHAKLLPTNVGRVYFAPMYLSQTNVFNKDGDRKWNPDATYEMFNMGMAWEHGLANGINIALQWTPGFNLQSKVSSEKLGIGEGAHVGGQGDVFVGAKLQLVGNTALIAPSDVIRIAFAPGLKVPLTKGPNFEHEFKKYALLGTDDIAMSKPDKNVLAAGWRFYFDYLFTKEFFVNFYNETIFYVKKGKLKNSGINPYYAQGAIQEAIEFLNDDPVSSGGLVHSDLKGGIFGDKVDYKYLLTFEIEPNYTWELTPKTTIEFGLPIEYQQAPAAKYTATPVTIGKGSTMSVGGPAALAAEQEAVMEMNKNLESFTNGKTAKYVKVKPSLGVFFMSWAVPMEFKVYYHIPVWGKNGANATNTFVTQIRVYYQI